MPRTNASTNAKTIGGPAVLAVSVFVLLAAAVGATAQVKSYQAPGNLESTRDLGCVGPATLRNTDPPPDLYGAISKCLQREMYKDAAFIFALAGVYGRYDTLRVADKTAHQAVTVLQMQMFSSMSKEKAAAFRKGLQDSLGVPASLAVVCGDIARIGPPGYHPRYMIQHGMGAFQKGEPSDGLVAGFDAPAAWKQSLDSYLHCPAP